jgi:hypothetical protein
MTPTLTQSRSSNGQDGNARHPSLLFSTPSLSMPPTHPQRNLQVQHHILCTTAASAESNQTSRPAYPHPGSFISRARGHPSSLRKMPVSCGPRPANLIDAMSDTQISDGASARKRRAINFGPTQQKNSMQQLPRAYTRRCGPERGAARRGPSTSQQPAVRSDAARNGEARSTPARTW